MMKCLVVVSLVFIISQIQAYSQKDDLVSDEIEVVHKSDAQLVEEKLFAYAQIVKEILRSPDSHASPKSPSSRLPSLPGLLFLDKNIEHIAGVNFEVDGVDFARQIPDKMANHKKNTLCTDPKRCNCRLRYQLGAARVKTNGVVTADCWVMNIPYCEGPCYDVFRYATV